MLVVGGAGYIGGPLTDRILEAAHDVRVFDILLDEDQYLKDVDFVHGNILDDEALRPPLILRFVRKHPERLKAL